MKTKNKSRFNLLFKKYVVSSNIFLWLVHYLDNHNRPKQRKTIRVWN